MKLLRRLYFWWYRKRNHIPHPREINPFLVKSPHIRDFAKLYSSGFTLEECATIISKMTLPPREPRFAANGAKLPPKDWQQRLFYGRQHTRERLRQIVWKIWRDQRVDRNIRPTP